MCLPGLSLVVSALFRWSCSISIHLSPRSVTPFFTGDATSIFICLPGLSLAASALFRWPCSIAVHLSPRSVAAGVQHFYSSPRSVTGVVRPFALAMQHLYSFVSQVSVLQECRVRVTHKFVPEECPTRVSRKSVHKSVLQATHKSVL